MCKNRKYSGEEKLVRNFFHGEICYMLFGYWNKKLLEGVYVSTVWDSRRLHLVVVGSIRWEVIFLGV